MNILHTVEAYSPDLGGMTVVVKHISEKLLKFGHSVTVATKYSDKRSNDSINGINVKQFNVYGNLVKGIQGTDRDKYVEYVLHSDFDIITNFAAQQWATDCLLDHLPEIKAKKIFVPTGFSGLYFPEYNNYFKQMINWMPNYDACIVQSKTYRDYTFAHSIPELRLEVIPNGALPFYFNKNYKENIREKFKIPKNAFIILLVGGHTGLKGHEYAIDIFRRSKISNAVLFIVGKNAGYCLDYCQKNSILYNKSLKRYIDRKKIIVCELNDTDVHNLFIEADIFLFPSQIECSPLVLYECLASKTPFLSSDVGNAREIADNLTSGVILPTDFDENGYAHVNINESVQVLEKMYENKYLRMELAEKGYRNWKEKYTWENVSEKYNDLYTSLL